MGWLAASPPSKNPKAKRKPRRVRLAAKGHSMHPADWGVDIKVSGYLLDACAEMGWAATNGMGPVPLPWTEIRAYGESTGQCFKPWEARTLRSVSECYVHAYTSTDELDPAYWTRYEGALRPFIPITGREVTLRQELEA